MNPTLRPLSLGEILDGAFVLYRRHFAPFYATALVAVLPHAALGGAAVRRSALGWGWVALALGALGCSCAAWGALQHLASAAALDQPVELGEGLRAGFRRLLPLWGQGVVLGVVWSVFTLFGVLGVGAGAMGVGGLGIPGLLLAILLWIGGVGGSQLVFLSLVSAAPAVVVIEKRGAFAAIGRAMELSRDALPRGMAVMGVCGLIALLPSLGLALLTGLLTPSGAPPADPGSAAVALRQAGALLVGSLTLPFLAAAVVLQYYDRRVRTEAFDVQLLADRLPAR